MSKNLKIFLSIILVSVMFWASMASAQGLVTCGNTPGDQCTLCDLLELIKNLVTFMTQLGLALAGLFFVWGAFVIMTAGAQGYVEGKADKGSASLSEGRKIITTTVVGVLIMFSAYLIIGTLLNVLTGSPSALPWSQIQCTL